MRGRKALAASPGQNERVADRRHAAKSSDKTMKAPRRRLVLWIACLVPLFATGLAAQQSPPKLQPYRAKYYAERDAVKAEQEQATAKAREVYERALANAERTAGSSRDVKVVAAIDREKKAVSAGHMAPVFPAELPASLQGARKDYLAALAKAAGEFAPRLQKIDAEYVAQLTKIDPGSDAEFARQIAAEKENVLAAAGTKAEGKAESLISRRSVVENGDFSLAEPGGAPKGWSPAYPGGSAKVVPDGGNLVLRLEMGDKWQNVGVKQDVPIPAGARSATFRAKMRGKPKNLKAENRAAAQITLRIKDAKGEMLAPSILNSKHSVQWQNEQRAFDLPPGAKAIEVVVRSIFAEGTFDFDDVSLEFR
jgi:hypothetical protein